jgi:hypothetical protein
MRVPLGCTSAPAHDAELPPRSPGETDMRWEQPEAKDWQAIITFLVISAAVIWGISL